jgi:hypothetical protein
MPPRRSDDELDRMLAQHLAEREAELLERASPVLTLARPERPAWQVGTAHGGNRGAWIALVLVALLLALVAAGSLVVGSLLPRARFDPRALRAEAITFDGVRPLLESGATVGLRLSTGPDGSVWGRAGDRLFRFGNAEELPTDGLDPDTEVTIGADGRPWARDTAGQLMQHDGTTWQIRREPMEGRVPGPFDVGPDGTAWSTMALDLAERPYAFVGRLDDGGWRDTPLGPDVAASLPGSRNPSLLALVAGRDEAWMSWRSADDGYQLLRAHDGFVEVVAPPGAPSPVTFMTLDSSPDGTVWVYLEQQVSADLGNRDANALQVLTRLAGGSWEVFSEAMDVPVIIAETARGTALTGGPPAFVRAGLDGHVWMTRATAAGACDGVTTFDGRGWTGFLDGTCVADLEIASDGTAWVVQAASIADPMAAEVIHIGLGGTGS